MASSDNNQSKVVVRLEVSLGVSSNVFQVCRTAFGAQSVSFNQLHWFGIDQPLIFAAIHMFCQVNLRSASQLSRSKQT